MASSRPDRRNRATSGEPHAEHQPAVRVQRLADDLLDGSADDVLAEELVGWLDGSSPFRAFAERHRDKIRKKLRGAIEREARLDVRAEIRAAQLLLADRRAEVAFEAYGARQVGPDLTVTLRGERPFNVEVTRLRRVPDAVALGNAVVGKLRQLPPSSPNVLLVAVDANDARSIDVASTVREMRALADRRDPAFLARGGFESGRAFYDRFLRLGAILVWCERAGGDGRAAAWVNGSARITVPARALRVCLSCLRAV